MKTDSDKEEQMKSSYLSFSPSFDRSLSVTNPRSGDESEGGSTDDEFEFEFSVASPAWAAADDIFSNGRILPVYPVFDQGLLRPDPSPAELRSSGSTSSSSSAESLEIDAPHCPWAPPAMRKSGSAGSGSESDRSSRWSIRDLVRGGRRSRSDGKEKLGLGLGNASTGSAKKGSGENKKEMDMVTAHRLFYGKDEKEKKRKSSFLPYRPELVGLFANSRAHHHHPFNI